MRFSFSDNRYNEPHNGKCWEMFHADIRNGPYCAFKELGHDGVHEGNGMRWEHESHATAEQASKFLACYRAIPNSHHEIWLNDDGTVGMSLSGFASATRFIHVGYGSD